MNYNEKLVEKIFTASIQCLSVVNRCTSFEQYYKKIHHSELKTVSLRLSQNFRP